jgi:hypothetical protein
VPVPVALWVLTWVVIAILYFGLAALLREVRLLRGLVLRDGYAGAPVIDLGPGFAGTVLAADTGCGLCLAVVERLGRAGAPVTVLTHEPAAVWDGLSGGLPVVTDREAWRSVAHLSPPVLMQVDRAGLVRRIELPERAEQADQILASWAGSSVDGGSADADVRADS